MAQPVESLSTTDFLSDLFQGAQASIDAFPVVTLRFTTG
jgi:hypothetical protein